MSNIPSPTCGTIPPFQSELHRATAGRYVSAVSCVLCLSRICIGQLILMKFTEIVATRCQISRLKSTSLFNFDSAPCPNWRACNAPQIFKLDFKGAASKRKELKRKGKMRRGKGGREREGGRGERREEAWEKEVSAREREGFTISQLPVPPPFHQS